LDDYLLGAYSLIFLESFEQKSLKISLKIFKIFITLLYHSLQQNFAKNMSLLKKFKFMYKVLLLFKNIGYNVFKMFLGIFHSLD
jgi:hypothetical protein